MKSTQSTTYWQQSVCYLKLNFGNLELLEIHFSLSVLTKAVIIIKTRWINIQTEYWNRFWMTMIIDLEASKEATHGLGKRSEEEASKEPYHTLQHILEFRNPKNVFLRPILLSFSPIQFRIKKNQKQLFFSLNAHSLHFFSKCTFCFYFQSALVL